MAFIGVRRCALTEDAFEWNLKCMRSVSRNIVAAFKVALTTSYIRVLYFYGQVLFAICHRRRTRGCRTGAAFIGVGLSSVHEESCCVLILSHRGKKSGAKQKCQCLA